MKIYKYNEFEYGNLNRRINDLNLKRKKASIAEVGLLSRITVTRRLGKLFIVDGQHRFLAMKDLKMDITDKLIDIIPYTNDENMIKIMSEMNGKLVKWNGMAYVEVFASAGNQTYQNIMEFVQNFPDFGITAYIPMLSIGAPKGSKITKHYLENGEFEVSNWKLSTKFANALMDISEYTEFYKHFQFVKAFRKIFMNKEYNHKVFISQLKKGKHMKKGGDIFYGVANIDAFSSLIKSVYNSGLRGINRVEFD